MNKKPNNAGIWEWIDDNGVIQPVEVVNVLLNCPDCPPFWRVYSKGSYYNIYDEHDLCENYE